MKKVALVTFTYLLIYNGYAQGFQDSNATLVDEADKIATEFSVPAIPALDFISADPAAIARPSNVKTLAAGLYNGIDEQGNVKQGLAVEVRVGEFIPMTITPKDYREDQKKFILYNTQISVGTIATSGDSASTDLGWGFRLTFFDNSDPMRNKNYLQEFEKTMLACAPNTPDDTRSQDEVQTCIVDSMKLVNDAFQQSHWNASWMIIAYAGGSRLSGSQVTEGKSIGHQIWLAGGFPLNRWGQISYVAKWSERLLTNEASLKIQELQLGAKLLAGRQSYNLFGELSYNPLLNKSDVEMMERVEPDKAFSWTIGVEFKVSTGVWAVAGFGRDAERITGNDGIQFLSGVRMGISKRARLK